MTTNNIRKIIPSSFMAKAKKGLRLTSEVGNAVYCDFCGKEKSEFFDPVKNRITLLPCKCEKHYDMLREFLDANVDWIVSPDQLPSDVAKYNDNGHHREMVNKAKVEYEAMRTKRQNNQNRRSEANDSI